MYLMHLPRCKKRSIGTRGARSSHKSSIAGVELFLFLSLLSPGERIGRFYLYSVFFFYVCFIVYCGVLRFSAHSSVDFIITEQTKDRWAESDLCAIIPVIWMCVKLFVE